jgi:hypothetical protein
MTILLSTLNARYSHAALGLRYLKANMGELEERTRLREFVIGTPTAVVVERILAEKPSIVGLGVYIWNIEEMTKAVAMLKAVAPGIPIVIGGPEVSHETGVQPIAHMADYVVTGWGEISFAQLCRVLLRADPPAEKIIHGVQAPLADIRLPYHLYDAEDIAQRTLYVEASRGCPFKCEFCLSSLDKTAWSFDLDMFLAEMGALYARGARQFKFVDRTFNLNIRSSRRILQFFLDKLAASPDDPVFAHFEMVPDHLPAELKDSIRQFPPGTLQLEIGIQSFNPEVQALISRRQDNDKSAENVRWLMEHTAAHLHVDLIAGLPGEDLASFASGFDRLVAVGPHEIQLGILKRLRGTPVIRHTAAFGLVFDPAPPYTVLATDRIGFADMQRMARFARYWDMVANSGRFKHTLALMLGDSPFARFMHFSDWLHTRISVTHGIALDRLTARIAEWLLEQQTDADLVQATLGMDYAGRSPRTRKKTPAGEARTDSAGLRRQTMHLGAEGSGNT